MLSQLVVRGFLAGELWIILFTYLVAILKSQNFRLPAAVLPPWAVQASAILCGYPILKRWLLLGSLAQNTAIFRSNITFLHP